MTLISKTKKSVVSIQEIYKMIDSNDQNSERCKTKTTPCWLVD